MTILSWDQNFLKSLDILTTGEEHDSVKIWRQNATTGLSLSRLLLCTLSPMFKEILQEICPCHSVSLVLPDNNKLGDNSRDFVTDILNLFSSPPSSSLSGPLENTCNDPEEREAEVMMLTSCVNSLEIDNESEQRYDTGESSDEDIFLTDDEECDENIPAPSPTARSNLPGSPAVDDRQSNSFSKENNNDRVDKGLECDLDGDEILNQESWRNVSEILQDLIESVVLVKIDMDNFEEEDISGEESFEECEEEYEDDEESDIFEDDSESDEEEESSSDPSWQADHSEDDDEEAEENLEALKTKTLKADNKNLSLVKERLDSSGMDSGSLSFYMSETGPISIQVRCGCKGTCFRNCSCKSAGADCSRWCGCDPRKCKSKLSQKQGLNVSVRANMSLQVENKTQPDDEKDTLIKTPECLPPPLSASTTGRRKKKLFTQSLGPQEFE